MRGHPFLPRADERAPAPAPAARCLLLLLWATAASATAAAAQGAGQHGLPVLRLAPAPRAEALGGAVPFADDDPFAVRSNPAHAAGLMAGMGAAFRSHPGDVAAGSVAAAFGAGPVRAGASLLFLDLGEVEERVPDPSVGGQAGLSTGRRFGGGELALGLALAAALGPLDVGAGGTVVRSGWADQAEVGVAADIGARARLLGGRLALAAAVLGLGPETGPGADAPLPRLVRVGAEVGVGGGPGAPRAVLVAEARGPGDALRPAAGVEVLVAAIPDAALLVRAGWRGDMDGGDALSPLAAGGTVQVGAWRFDYAFRGGDLMGAAHEVAFRWVPGGR